MKRFYYKFEDLEPTDCSLRTEQYAALYKTTHKSKNKNRYNYMLFDAEPDDKITGGMLYEKGEIDKNLVKNLVRKIKDL